MEGATVVGIRPSCKKTILWCRPVSNAGSNGGGYQPCATDLKFNAGLCMMQGVRWWGHSCSAREPKLDAGLFLMEGARLWVHSLPAREPELDAGPMQGAMVVGSQAACKRTKTA
eukprot:1161013-Pelagomonas_calceolata.AAC.7